ILIGRSSFSFIELCEKALALLRLLRIRGAYWGRRARGAWAYARALRKQEAQAEGQLAFCGADPRPLFEDDLKLAEWEPRERTGAPPLAIAESLRRQVSELRERLQDVPSPTSPTPAPRTKN